MEATAVTYRTGNRHGELRTVLVRDARKSVVLLPSGSLEILQATLLHGMACRHEFWDDILGTSGDDFVISADQIVQIRTIRNVKTRRH